MIARSTPLPHAPVPLTAGMPLLARVAVVRQVIGGALGLAGRRLSRRLRSEGAAAARSIGGLWELSRREGLPRLAILMFLLHLTLAAAVYLAELKTFVPQAEGQTVMIDSLPKAFWWAIVTMTTTGYGDLTPVTALGRVLASVLMVSGVLTFSMFTASFASMLVATRLQQAQGLSVLNHRNHIVIIGWNRTAEQVIEGLLKASVRRPQFVLINQLPLEQLQELKFRYRSINLEAIRGDATHEAILVRANVKEAGSVLLLADTTSGDGGAAIDDRTLFVALAVRDLNAEVKLAAELTSPEKESAIRHAGVEEIVIAGHDTSFFLASSAMAPGLARAARQILTYGSGRELRRVEMPRELRGTTFGEARRYFRLNGDLLIGIISEGAVVTIGDVLGSSTDWIDEFIRTAFTQSGQDVVARHEDRTVPLIPPPDAYVIGNKDHAIVIGGGKIG